MGVSVLFGAVATQTALAADVDYWYRYGGQLAVREKNWIERFSAAHPDTHVNLSIGDDFDKVKVSTTAGSGPDVYLLTTLNIPEFAAEHFAADLEPFLTQDQAQINPETVFMPTIYGARYPADSRHVYAVPINYVTSLLYYNPNLFADAGVAAPNDDWTWETFAAAAKKLTHSGSGNAADTVYGFSMGTSNYEDVQPAILSNGGTFLNAAHTGAAVDNPIAAQTVGFFADLIKGGYATLSGTKPFMEGKAAMTIDGSWAIGGMGKSPYQVALLPKGSARRALYGASDMLAMSTKAKDPAAAWQLLKANMLDRGAAFYIESGWFPVSTGIVHSAEWQMSKYNNPVFFKASAYMTNTASLNWYQWIGAVAPVFQAALQSKISPQEAVKKAQTLIDAAIKSGQAAEK